jgi:hypothetical protein
VTDVRELILARLVEVVATVPNLRTIRRNNILLMDDKNS